MAYLASWIQQLVLAVILATFLDLLLPSNAMQRYVRLVMGLLILMLILSPLLTLLKSDWDINNLFSHGRSEINGEVVSLPHIQSRTDELAEEQEQWVEETVQSRMERSIRGGIEQRFALTVNEVSVSLSENEGQVSVDEVIVAIDPDTSADGNGKIATVEPVHIDISENRDADKTEKTSRTVSSPHIAEIREWVSREWHINDATIQIVIAEQGDK